MIGASLLLASLVGASADPPAIRPDDFRAWFSAASRGELDVPADVGRRARDFRYVFVGGFASEQMRGYFAQNARELRSLGVKRSAIHTVFPSSSRTIEEGAAKFREEVLAISEKGPEKLVVIAHSRGACDALAFALNDPGFVAGRVEALFLVQGAFGGTALADYVVGEGPEMDELMPTRYRIVAHLVGRLEKAMVNRGDHAGISGLTREAARAYWNRTVAEHVDALDVLGPRTFYIRSGTEPSRLGRFRRAIGVYLTTYDRPNDGIVAVEDQYIPGLGTSLCVLECGHGDLTCNLASGRAAKRVQRALTQCVVMGVGRAATAPVTASAR